MIIQNGHFNVYVHTNKTNGKVYVGITGRNPIERWKANGKGYETSPKFYGAIRKYGWDNFDHEIYASNLTEEEARHMEYFLIKTFELQNDAYGYNVNDGGTVCTLQEETKIKIGNILRGRVYSDEKKKMYSNAHKGKKLSKEHSNAISKANKGRPKPEIWKQHMTGKLDKPVMAIEINKIFPSMKAASEETGTCYSSISNCCKSKRQTAGGYHWKFVEKPRD